ncbi:hypothetical protein GFS24_04025 [Chitinophaga sp. SYP-B3965]|uniref:hypothetical protein n=1 Tax=Chitinophaga sp. SYP-B3965 TaxID=2663120 RepID=UPI00129A0451|nr:hypothetical protein [Chitinophaga sp. SYP-B3965]MRG44265.1 hypothetical protein [Chitinophaga sp. SYP-B3965]
MRKVIVIFILALTAFSGCKKDDFYDKFVPEVLYYEKDKVENADFVTTTLPAGTTQWTVKARVSAPMHLKEIKLYKGTDLLETYTDFQLSPNVYNLQRVVTGITAETTMKIVAVDADNKTTTRTFIIKVN